MSEFQFYYDESEHSREINQKTINAENYYDNFITVIVGWGSETNEKITRSYLSFEEKYASRMVSGELKSSTIKNSQLKNGFASLHTDNVTFLSDFLKQFTDEISFFFCVMSKIEYVIWQLFSEYHDFPLINTNALKYSIVKALIVYKPQDVIDCIYQRPKDLVKTLESFLERKIIENQTHLPLKEKENKAFTQALFILGSISPISSLRWAYDIPFIGFEKYLHEKGIYNYSLVIDREGKEQKTLNAALGAGIANVADGDSKDYSGIRIADMMAGLLAKMMKSLSASLIPRRSDKIQKIILPESWFELRDNQLKLYKQLHHVIMELDHRWYKAYAGNYADDLVTFISLLDYMNHFSSVDEMKENRTMHGEYFNKLVCDRLTERYRQM